MEPVSIIPQSKDPNIHDVSKFATNRQALIAYLHQEATDYINSLSECVSRIQEAYRQRLEVLNANRDVLGSGGRKPESVQLLESELLLNAPLLDIGGKRLTVELREAWVQTELAKQPVYKDLQQRAVTAQSRLATLDAELEVQGKRYGMLLAFLNWNASFLASLGGERPSTVTTIP